MTAPRKGYDRLVGGISKLLAAARSASARVVNAVMTATYWEIGRRIVEFEQKGETRAEYGAAVVERLSTDLTARFGRGFGMVNLSQMKKFSLPWPTSRILQTPSEKSLMGARFPLPWSAYVRLLAVRNEKGRRFYETEALRGGRSVRQLDRQIGSQFYERTALSKNKAEYGERILKQLEDDLSRRYGRGLGWCNLFQMRAFYLAYPKKLQTLSAKFESSALSRLQAMAASLLLPWSASSGGAR